MGGACSAYGGEPCTGFWWGDLRERDNLGRPRRRWEDNIKMDLRQVEYEGTNWIDLAQDRDRWRALVQCGNEPSGSVKCGEFLD